MPEKCDRDSLELQGKLWDIAERNKNKQSFARLTKTPSAPLIERYEPAARQKLFPASAIAAVRRLGTKSWPGGSFGWPGFSGAPWSLDVLPDRTDPYVSAMCDFLDRGRECADNSDPIECDGKVHERTFGPHQPQWPEEFHYAADLDKLRAGVDVSQFDIDTQDYVIYGPGGRYH